MTKKDKSLIYQQRIIARLYIFLYHTQPIPSHWGWLLQAGCEIVNRISVDLKWLQVDGWSIIKSKNYIYLNYFDTAFLKAATCF